MGIKVQYETNCFQAYHSMRDLNEDSSSNSWPTCYGDKNITYGQQYYNGFISRTTMDGNEIDALKQKMVEHETIFKSQLYELHRLYRIQKEMMEEVKRKESHRLRVSTEPSSSSSLRVYQLPSGDAEKKHSPDFPLFNSGYGRTSTSGVIEIGNSRMSCTKEYNKGPTQPPFLNGPTLKVSESLHSRPSKVRKKLFDLQLPADTYIDTEERENFPDKNIGLADLNEPIQIEEETVVPSSINFLGHVSISNGDTKGMNRPEKSNAYSTAVNGESMHLRDGFLQKSGFTSKVDEGRVPHIYEAESSKSGLYRQDKLPMPSYTVEGMLNPINYHPGKNHHNVVVYSDLSRDQSNNGHLEHSMASRTPSSYPFFTSSCFSNSWAQSVSSHSMQASSFTQKRAIFDSSLNAVTTIDRNWKVNGSSSWNPNVAGELNRNGFYHGSGSGTRDAQFCLPLPGCSYPNPDKGNNSCHDDKKKTINIDLNEVVDLTITDGKHKPEDHLSALPWLKHKPPPHNKEATNTSQDETVKDIDRFGASKSTITTSNSGILEAKTVKKILGVPIFETGALKTERSALASVCFTSKGNDADNERKKMIIGINLECEPDNDDDVADGEKSNLVQKNQRNIGVIRNNIDLNSCVSDSEDPSLPSFESKTTNVKRILEIDLEALPLQESEDDIAPLFKENTEDNLTLQSLETKNKPVHDEFLQNAAEIVFSISSFCPQTNAEDNINPLSETSLSESLLWFVNIVSLHSNEHDNNTNHDSSDKESVDDFEAMTLQLEEMKEEDYLPRPFIPEVQEIEETGTNNSLLTQSRRGHSRRGRQRKDFQRDILPGLATLSRHEVTEDLQTFGGLMRAMGHHWNSGLMRRNGGGRGRRRAAIVEPVSNNVVQSQVCAAPLVQKLGNNIETGLEDRSLTGWGKTTRRPRRQRCHAGNNTPTAVLT